MRRAGGFLLRFALILALTMLAITAALMLLPTVFFGPTEHYTRGQANQSYEVIFRPTDGDLFRLLPERVRPPEDNAPVATFTMRWDADGWRVGANPSDSQPVAVLGDSFIEGYTAEFPLTDRLSDLLGVGVANYGFRAYGPVEEARAAAEFLPRQSRSTVVYAYYINDLNDALRGPKVDVSTPLLAWANLAAKFITTPAPVRDENGTVTYEMPVTVNLPTGTTEMAFFPLFWSWLQAPDAGFYASREFVEVIRTMDAIDTAAPDACRLLLYIPPKEQVYFPYLEADYRASILRDNYRLTLLDDGRLRREAYPFDPDAEQDFIGALNGQRDALATAVESQMGWTLVDLMPAFSEAASEGAVLYFPYDVHWTQAGHDLAAQVLAEAIRAMPDCL
jgi:hypothetical protein